ncbi:hypothetical protein ACQY0O_003758 [Thecaphora frezii]
MDSLAAQNESQSTTDAPASAHAQDRDASASPTAQPETTTAQTQPQQQPLASTSNLATTDALADDVQALDIAEQPSQPAIDSHSHDAAKQPHANTTEPPAQLEPTSNDQVPIEPSDADADVATPEAATVPDPDAKPTAHEKQTDDANAEPTVSATPPGAEADGNSQDAPQTQAQAQETAPIETATAAEASDADKRSSIIAAEQADEAVQPAAVETAEAAADAGATQTATKTGAEGAQQQPPGPVDTQEKGQVAAPDLCNEPVITSTPDHISKTTASQDASAGILPSPPAKATAPLSAASQGRAALADPASVAAVAQAFGRGASGVSSTDNSRPSSRSGVALNQKSLPNFAGEAAPGAKAEASAPASGFSGAAAAEQGKADDGRPSESAGLLSPNPMATAGGAYAGERRASSSSSSSAGGRLRIGKGPPPSTQPSEELPFDFNRFLEQMKHRSATPVGEYVRSFIKGFAKKPYRTADQVKLIFDFLAFISERMKECEVWATLTNAEFDNAKEAMEKLIMNRLYPHTFTPAVQKEGRWNVQTDDLERDRILKQRIKLFGWLKEEHLDVPVGDHSRGFIEFSIQELLKINHYKAPRDKLICILNCCKVIFGMIRHLSTEENADTFIPVLIFVVLKANPDHLISNVEYISRFRNPERLSSESGYYLSSLMGAIAFIETMDYTSLSNITQEEFERNVEQAVQTIPEPESPLIRSGQAETSPRQPSTTLSAPSHNRTPSSTSVTAPNVPGEESAKALPLTPMAASLADDTRAFFQRTGEAARAGLGRPMGALGRLINEGIEGIRTPSGAESGSSTGRTSSPNPAAGETAIQGITASSSRSRLFAGLFGPAEPEPQPQQQQPPRSPLVGAGRTQRRPLSMDEEPQTPSTDELAQGGFLPYNMGQPGAAPNAPPRLRPQMPTRGYSIDDHDDYDSVGRRNLLAGRGVGRRGSDDEDLAIAEEDDEDDPDTPNVDAMERMRRRRQMQHTFGSGDGFLPPFLAEAQAQANAQQRTPSRTSGAGLGVEERRLTRGPMDDTQRALQQSWEEHQRMQDDEAQEEAQQSAGVETLKSIFPGMDTGVIRLVLQGCEGDVEVAIDRLLEMQ